MVFGISLLILVLLFSLVSAVRINEVELNPEGTDSGDEWVELYSENEVNLSNWSMVNNDGDIYVINEIFQGYLIINFQGRWLDNSDEKIILKDDIGETKDETIILEDNENDNRTWQYCNNEWAFLNETKESVNSCEGGAGGGEEGEQEERGEQEQQPAEISLKLEWDGDEIINGEDFEIESRVYNLEDKVYEIKVYMTFKENDTLISETYYEDKDRWKSSTYYIDDAVTGPGNKSKTFSLRVKDKYENFKGNAKLKAKIRKSGTTSIIAEFEENIEILEKEETPEEQKEEEQTVEVETEEQDIETEIAEQKKEIIRLGNRNQIKQAEVENGGEGNTGLLQGRVIYESGSEKVKKYAIYVLNLILIAIIVFLLVSFKKEKKLSKVKKERRKNGK